MPSVAIRIQRREAQVFAPAFGRSHSPIGADDFRPNYARDVPGQLPALQRMALVEDADESRVLKTTFAVPMTCDHCVQDVSGALHKLQGKACRQMAGFVYLEALKRN